VATFAAIGRDEYVSVKTGGSINHGEDVYQRQWSWPAVKLPKPKQGSGLSPMRITEIHLDYNVRGSAPLTPIRGETPL
jgi:hypothetical protein